MSSSKIFRSSARLLCLALVFAIGTPSVLLARPKSHARLIAQAQQQTRPLPPTQYIPSHDYDQRHITLNLHFDWDKEQAIGTETFTFAPLVNDFKRLDLDATSMTFNSVKLAGGKPLTFEADTQNNKLHVNLDRAYQLNDEITIIIDYRTNGTAENRSVNGGGGLTFIKPTATDPKRPRQIWSQGESEYNHFWFPCFDHPNDFATTEIFATVEKPFMVISNGKLLETKNNNDNTRTFHWKIDQPHATYLTSIIVGEYAAVEQNYAGIPVITYVYPNEVNEGKVTAARLAEMVRFFSEKTGVKYPYAKYAQTMTRDFNGGMENISATTMYDFMIHDARTELDQTSDSIQSHELAHQWFGDYVTCRTWADIWLNESFATYFQALWDEHSLGRDDFLYRDVKSNQDDYYRAWARGSRRPIVTKNYRDPDAVFDTYAYPRGGAVLHMLRVALGDENWWRSINHYLTKYAHQPVQTEQFRIAIEETTGQSMDWFFDQWLYKMGHPVFNVSQNYDPASKTLTLKVRQEQKPDPDSGYPQATFFRTPVDVEIGTNSSTRVERVWIEAQEEQSFSFKVDSQPLLVNFDYGDTLIKELRFEKTTDELVYQLQHDPDVTGRLWALGLLTGRMNTDTPSETQQRLSTVIAGILTGDKFWGVRLEAAAALSGIKNDAARNALLAATKDANARVRARAIASLSASRDAKLASVYLQSLSDQSYGVIRAAALALGETKDPAAYDALLKLIDVPSWRDNIRAAALSGLAATGDRRALELGFRYAATANSIPVRAAALTLLGEVGKDDPRTFPILADALKESVAVGSNTLGNAAGNALVAQADPRAADLFEEMAKQSTNQFVQFIMRQFAQRLQEKKR